jgi:Coenzyme F420-reducing hydrogenase, gamma subunit
MKKLRLATTWLDGCSGCHMSALDMDERWIELASLVDLVYSPLVDAKEYPENVDVVLVEGAVSSEEDLEKIQKIRERTKILVSLGDCAVTANVPSMRNRFPVAEVEHRAYIENAQLNQQVPRQVIPALLPKSRPVHEFVDVDVFVPGCPPSAETIHFVLMELLAGRMPDLAAKTRFGA